MSSLSKREKILLCLLGVVLIGFLYYKFVATPALNKYYETKKSIEDNRVTLQNLREAEKNLKSIKAEIEEMALQTQEFSKVIPDTDRVPEIIVSFEDMTKSAGTDGGSLLFVEPFPKGESSASNAQEGETGDGQGKKSDSEVMVLPISYQVTGDYNSIMSLLSKIEENGRKMIIDDISITRDEKSQKLSARLSITSFYINREEEGNPAAYPFSTNTRGKWNIFQ